MHEIHSKARLQSGAYARNQSGGGVPDGIASKNSSLGRIADVRIGCSRLSGAIPARAVSLSIYSPLQRTLVGLNWLHRISRDPGLRMARPSVPSGAPARFPSWTKVAVLIGHSPWASWPGAPVRDGTLGPGKSTADDRVTRAAQPLTPKRDRDNFYVS